MFRWAVNSGVECHPHTVEVTGSNPVPPTTDDLNGSQAVDFFKLLQKRGFF